MNQLIVDLFHHYETTLTYRDSGIAHVGEDGLIRFETSFIRPDKFKFQWIWNDNPTERNLLWRDGNDVYVKHHEKNESMERFDVAVAGACGATGTVASEIAGLLMPLVIPTRLRIASYHDPSTRRSINGIECEVIDSTELSEARVRLCIDEARLALRRAEITFGLSKSQATRAMEQSPHPELEGCLPIGFTESHKTVIIWEAVEFQPDLTELERSLERQ